MATQTMRAMGPSHDDTMKTLPSSPTLTNPDMVLPDRPSIFSSPPRNMFERPPSPSYLRATTSMSSLPRDASSMASKKEKRGLMSRKMMLLRSRTASNGVQVVSSQPIPRSMPSEGYSVEYHGFSGAEDRGSSYGSSPTLMDVGNLAPEQPQSNRDSTGGSSFASEDMSGLPQFLARYKDEDSATNDDEVTIDGSTVHEHRYSASIEEGLEAQRRQQEENEHTSAILSQRAEEILANAKKRLNLMEGNLRGARDLVTPLTTANLKRATSVGSSVISSMPPYGSGPPHVHGPQRYESPSRQQYRKLQAQASSPTMGRDFQSGHLRGASETNVPDRAHTALDRTASPISAKGRIPVKANDPSWSNALRGSRSYDSFGTVGLGVTSGRDRMHSRGSPDSTLEPLTEDDGYYHAMSDRSSNGTARQEALPLRRSSSQAEALRDQMSSLRGKISSLKEKAREDSLRRQSMLNLREPSPLNNANGHAPELFYTSSQGYGSPVLDTNAGVGHSSQDNSPVTPQSAQKLLEPKGVFTGSRNAFAEQELAVRTHQQPQDGNGSSRRSSQRPRRPGTSIQPGYSHTRTPSGTAIVQSSKQRYSHHQVYRARNDPENDTNEGSVYHEAHGRRDEDIGVARDGSSMDGKDDERSETGNTVYEDAKSESHPAPPVVAHEDREDAFDYENFFLHSAMQAVRRASNSSEETASSTETARGPTAPGAEADEGDQEIDGLDDMYPPPSPETPERLREIERSLHKRTFSDESVSTEATFATATEGRASPDPVSKRTSLNWPMAPEPIQRPSTAIQLKHPSLSPIALSDSSSERADSGVGLPHRPSSSQSARRPAPRSLTSSKSAFSPNVGSIACPLSPPMSPRMLKDPATTVVQALLAPTAQQLGLKDKALLYGLVESLTKVCHALQEGQEGDYESRMLRRRLDEAKRVLDGRIAERSGPD